MSVLFHIEQVYSQDKKINFATGTWAEIVANAKAQNKPIFVDFYAEWCGPCKMMSKQVFTDAEVADYYNQNFISVKIDAEKQEQDLVSKSGITAYPSLFYFTPDGMVLTKNVGALNAKQFKSFGEKAVGMLDIAKKLPEIKAKYEANPKDLTLTATYIKALLLSNKTEEAESIAAIYLPQIAEKDLSKVENWEIVSRCVKDLESREFQYVIKNPKIFLEQYGEEAYAGFFYAALDNGLAKAIKAQAQESLTKIKQQYAIFNTQMGSEQEEKYHNLLLDIFYYKSIGNKPKYFEALSTHTDLYLLDNYNELVKRTFEVFQNYNDTESIAKTEVWATKLLKMDNNGLSNYVMAVVYSKQNKKAEAKKYLVTATEKNKNPELDQYLQALKQELEK